LPRSNAPAYFCRGISDEAKKKWFHDVDDRSKTFFDACFDVDVASVDIDGCDVKVNVADFEQLVPKGKTD
jgi:hypothetical protein